MTMRKRCCSSYICMYVCVIIYMYVCMYVCDYDVCVLVILCVPSYYCICVLVLLYICPRTTTCVSSYSYYMRVLTLLHNRTTRLTQKKKNRQMPSQTGWGGCHALGGGQPCLRQHQTPLSLYIRLQKRFHMPLRKPPGAQMPAVKKPVVKTPVVKTLVLVKPALQPKGRPENGCPLAY